MHRQEARRNERMGEAGLQDRPSPLRAELEPKGACPMLSYKCTPASSSTRELIELMRDVVRLLRWFLVVLVVLLDHQFVLVTF